MGFIPVGEDTQEVGDDDVKCLGALCRGIRLAQEIVDAPTNEMHTDAFLDVSLIQVYEGMKGSLLDVSTRYIGHGEEDQSI